MQICVRDIGGIYITVPFRLLSHRNIRYGIRYTLYGIRYALKRARRVTWGITRALFVLFHIMNLYTGNTGALLHNHLNRIITVYSARKSNMFDSHYTILYAHIRPFQIVPCYLTRFYKILLLD